MIDVGGSPPHHALNVLARYAHAELFWSRLVCLPVVAGDAESIFGADIAVTVKSGILMRSVMVDVSQGLFDRQLLCLLITVGCPYKASFPQVSWRPIISILVCRSRR